MKRTLILLIIFLLLGGAALWYMTSQGDSKTTVAGADREFAIKDESQIHKVFIADRYGHKSTLEREGDHWIYNGKYRARDNAMENLLDAATRIEMKFKPPQAAIEKMVESLATEGLKVELYDKENQMLKSYYIGGSTPDERGTYVMLSDAEQPYVAHLPGWEGNLRFRFSLNDDEWRDRTLFALEVEDIQSVAIEYPKQRNKSFRLEKDGSDYKLTPFYDITPVINKPLKPAGVETYLSNFKKIVATGFHNEYEKKDEITSVLPFATIAVKTADDQAYEYSLFPIYSEEQKDPKTGGVLANANISNYYVETQDGDLLTIQSRIINKIMWGYEFFYK